MIETEIKAQNRPLYTMFNAVPPRYDLTNHVITLGMDSGWRRQAALTCVAGRPVRMLDVGCGTGDLAINVARLSPDTKVTGLDYSQPMLDIATRKVANLTGNKPAFIQGDAASLPFPDNYFDCVGISFAFRNLMYRNPLADSFIAEVLRVLAPGGRFVAVESSQPESSLVRKICHFYLRAYVYWMGWLVSGNRGAYKYLSESAARFYSPAELKKLLLKAGFQQISYRPLFFGAAGIHVAVK